MNAIVTHVTQDETAGYDEFGQFILQTKEDGYITTRIVRDVRFSVCPICGNGWTPDHDSIANQYVAKLHDNEPPIPVHKTCYKQFVKQKYESNLSKIISKTLFKLVWVSEVPNQYNPHNGIPWYRLTVSKNGRTMNILIGRRKRVDSIIVEQLTDDDKSALILAFNDENVTKAVIQSSYLIHAWDDEKLYEYLRKIASTIF